ncbi:MAG: hypothetical protein HJHJAOHD_01474 [Flavobacteriales bacterium]|nr:hypothetical protein [Flavobacteriales bacterium]MCL4816513.1 hypothetical protein [Flavobacteriales bacterium]WKZ75245.1 MAG: hypothetical protein QY303_13980 [Vicingaceae bacterium]
MEEIEAENIDINSLENNKILSVVLQNYSCHFYKIQGLKNTTYLMYEKEDESPFYFFTVLKSWSEIIKQMNLSVLCCDKKTNTKFKRKTNNNTLWLDFTPTFICNSLKRVLYTELRKIKRESVFNKNSNTALTQITVWKTYINYNLNNINYSKLP